MGILITGARGTVGHYVMRHARRLGGAVHGFDLEELDVADRETTLRRITGLKPRSVIHLAAATNVDQCEEHPDQAWRANTLGARNVAEACGDVGATCVLVSTTQVFGTPDGDPEAVFDELSTPTPCNVYAKTKLEGEYAARDVCRHLVIARTAWVMGGGVDDRKFVGKVRDKLVEGAAVKAVKDQFGSPTYADDLARALVKLVEVDARGVVHLTNTGRACRLDMVRHIKQVLGSKSRTTGVPASAFPLPAPRPASDASRSVVLPALGLGDLMPSWEDALTRYLQSWDGA